MRILIVDNSPVVRKVAKRILDGEEATVVEADTAAAALEICEFEMPHIIICDNQIADMPVVDLIGAIHDLGKDGESKIFLNLHEMDLVAIMRAKRAGASGFLLKPFNRNQLLDKFQVLLNAA